jgi:hypothetical protein
MMKKTILLIVVLALGWAGFSYVSAAWTRNQFVQEVDSLLQSSQGLSEVSLPPLLLNKAQQFGIVLDPDDIEVRIGTTEVETTTSRLVEKKGLTANVLVLTLRMSYTQSVLGRPRGYTLSRERRFTSRVTPPSPLPSELNPVFER